MFNVPKSKTMVFNFCGAASVAFSVVEFVINYAAVAGPLDSHSPRVESSATTHMRAGWQRHTGRLSVCGRCARRSAVCTPSLTCAQRTRVAFAAIGAGPLEPPYGPAECVLSDEARVRVY